jgi:hypothetical protein
MQIKTILPAAFLFTLLAAEYNPNPGGTGGPQWQIGYQYFGGIYWWLNSWSGGYIRSASPTKLGNAKPGWVLAADIICKLTYGDHHETIVGTRL